MNRILLLLEHTENRRLLSELLSQFYEVIIPDAVVQSGNAVPLLDEEFDLCLLDGVTLNHVWEWVQAKKRSLHPVFLPFLLITFRSDVKLLTRNLWQSIDELITKPMEKLELQARVEMLLRSRQLSLELNATNQRLQQQISERERAVSLLRQSEFRFQRLVQSSIVGIVIADFNGNITEANDAFLKIVGYTREQFEAGDVRWIDMTPSEYSTIDEQAIEQMKADGDSTPYEKEYIRYDGSRVPVLVGSIQLVPDELDCVAFIIDITERKQAEIEIQNALEQEKELNQLKSRFISMVSHEFRNPLSVISGYAYLLRQRGSQWTEQKQNELLQRIEKAVGKLVELLDDVLLISRGQVGKQPFNPSAININSFCRDLVTEMQVIANPSHQIILTTPDIEIQCNLDETLLRQIFTNLLTNAIKYSPQAKDILFELNFNEQAIVFKIRDEGIGISSEDQQKLFESFYRAGNVGVIPGTGLGLAIVKQAVDLHKGEISLVSSLGIGTTFTVILPKV